MFSLFHFAQNSHEGKYSSANDVSVVTFLGDIPVSRLLIFWNGSFLVSTIFL